VFVLGERQGQRVPHSGPVGGMPPNVGMGVGAGAGVGVGLGMGVGGRPDAQAMIAQQNREMEALERRSQRERSGSMNPAQVSRVARKKYSATSFFFGTDPSSSHRGNRSRHSDMMKKTRRRSSSIYRLGPLL
jgi:hypothetical protein